MNKTNKIVLVSLLFGAAAIGYALYTNKKVNQMCKIMNMAVDKVADGIDVDVSEMVLSEAIDRAVAKEVATKVRYEIPIITNKIRSDIKTEVAAAVSSTFTNVKESVSTEVRKQVSNIDITDMKKEIREEARELVVKKFEGNLDSLLSDFNQNLNNVGKIYSSIADNMKIKQSA